MVKSIMHLDKCPKTGLAFLLNFAYWTNFDISAYNFIHLCILLSLDILTVNNFFLSFCFALSFERDLR